jgi:RNA polymerase sigma factor (sigma-70 family)
MTTSCSPTHEAVVAVWQLESGRVVAGLARMTRDLQLAEDLAQDALVAALEAWPRDGVPASPGAWLMTVAKRRAIDTFRRAERHRQEVARLGHDLTETTVTDLVDHVDHVEDDVLRLMFLTCHPALTAESRAALTLRLVGGLTTEEIARGFQVKDTAVGQRISRAKKTLSQAHVDFELPTGPERTERLDDVMAVIYLIFNEGYTATAGEEWMRPDLANEAIRLARMLAALAPDEPEVHSLQALLEIQGSRMTARLGEDGTPVLLEAQDRKLWDQLLIRRGLAALRQAELLGARGKPVGKYFLQASIAAQHARAVRAEDTDWSRIAALYDVLAEAAPGPVVEVNRAVAHGRAFGPDAGLAVLEALEAGVLGDSPLVPSVRGDLLERAGLHAQAAEAFTEAASSTRNERERAVLHRRAELNLTRLPESGEPPGGS